MNGTAGITRRARAIQLLAVLALVPLLFGGLLLSTPNVAASLDTGDTVIVTTDALNLRNGPGLSAGVIRVLRTYDVMDVRDGPVSMDGYAWYEVDAYLPPDLVRGWVAGAFVTPIADVPGNTDTAFPGLEVVVNTDSLHVRSGPGLTYPVVRTMYQGNAFFAGPDPVRADGYTWYEMSVPDKPALGWVAGEFLVANSPSGETARFAAGDDVVVATDALNLRAGPGVDASVIRVLPYTTSMQVTGAPVIHGNHAWYPVATAGGESGWVAGDFLERDTGRRPDDVAGVHKVVDAPALNLRSEAGLASTVVAVLQGGEAVTVLGGPISRDGYHWLQVRTANGLDGWVIDEALSPTGSTGFSVNDGVRVADGPLNLRAEPGVSAQILRALQTGHLLRVTDGPVVQDGHTWYQVFDYGVGFGWVAGEYLRYEPAGYPAEDGGS